MPFTQSLDFNASFQLATTNHIPISSPKVLSTSTNLKFRVCKYFNKVTIDRDKRAQYKLCQDISCDFLKNAGTSPLSRHIKSKHLKHQPR